MKRFRTLSIVMLAVLTFAACSNEDVQDNPSQNDKPGGIYIKLDQVAQSTNRSVTDPFEDDIYTNFTNGGIFFTDDAGNILNPFIISDDAGASIRPSDLKAGYIFGGVSAKATRVVVVGNQAFASGTSFSTIDKLVEDYPINLEGQIPDPDPVTGVDEKLSIDNATMWGEGALTVHVVTITEPWEREAEVSLLPVLARFELGTLTAEEYAAPVPPSTISEGIDAGYKVDAVFLNNYYWATNLNGNAADPIADLTNWKKDWLKYFPTSENGEYGDEYEKIIFDMSNVTASGHVAQAAAGKVWAYNAFATSQATPHIIIKLSNIKQDGNLRQNAVTGIPGTGYITINRYLDLTDNVSIYPIENGVVYSIDNLEFSYSDIADTPEPGGDFSVKVTVKVLPWKVQEVGGGIDRG